MAIAVLAVLLLVPGLVMGPSDDAAAFTLAGRLLTAGDSPYRDVWDHKPPGILLATAAAQILLPFISPWHAVWVLSAAAVVAAAWIAGKLAWLVRPERTPAIIASLLAAAAIAAYPMASGGGLTETVAVAPASAAVLLAIRGKSLRANVAAGALVATAIAISVQSIPALIAVLVAAVATQAHRRLTAPFGALAGVAAVFALVAAYLVATGSLPAAIDEVVRYNLIYARLPTVISDLQLILQVMTLLALFAGLGLPAAYGILSRPSCVRSLPVTVLLVWAAATLAFLLAQGRPFAQYAVVGVVPLAALAGASAGTTKRNAARAVRLLRATAVGMLIAVSLIALPRDSHSLEAAAARVEAATPPGGTLFVWGVQPALYLEANSSPATRYIYGYPIVTPYYWNADRTRSLVDELRESPPSLIVDASNPDGLAGFVPLLVKHPVLVDRGRTLDTLGPLRRFVATRYDLLDEVAGYRIYQLRPDSVSS